MPYVHCGNFMQTSRFMKNSLLILTACISFMGVSFAHNANGQGLLDKKVDLQLHNASYHQVLLYIEKNVGAHFVYQTHLFQQAGKINITSKQEKLKTLLDRLLQPLDIQYELSYHNYIILTKNKKTAQSALVELNQELTFETAPDITHTVLGKVMSEGHPVEGASVILEGLNRGTSTNQEGAFTMSKLAAGQYFLQVSHIGFSNFREKITITDEDITLQINLPGDLLDLQKIVVTSAGSPKKKIESAVAITTVPANLLEDRVPLNSADVIRSIPGIMASSNGGDGPGNVRVRGLPSGGGYQFFGVMEDGLPVLPTGFNSFPSPDQNFKADLTIKTIEAIRGGNAPLVMANTPGALMNNISYTGANKTYGKFKFTTGLTQEMFRLDGNMGGSINPKVKYNFGGFFRTDKGIRPPTYTANKGGQLKANVTWNFSENGFVRVYVKYLNDRVQWQLPGVYAFNKEKKSEPIQGFDMFKETLVPAQTKFDVQLPDGSTNHFNLENGYRTRLGYGGFLFQYSVNGWTIKNNFRYQYNDIAGNFSLIAGVTPFVPNRTYYYKNGQQLVNPKGYYAIQQLNDSRRLESQLINYLEVTKKTGKHSFTFGGGVYFYDVISHEGINAMVSTEIRNHPKVILINAASAPAAFAVANNNPQGHVKYDGVTQMSSVYALDEWTLSDKVRFEAGIRMDRFHLHGTKAVYEGSSMSGGGPGFYIFGMAPWSNEEINWSASIATNYKFNNSLAFFVRGTRSYHAFNIADYVAIDFNPASLKKHEILMAELGCKYAHGKFSLFSALAYTAGSKLPLVIHIPTASGAIFTQSTFASSRSISWETEATYQLWKGLNLRLTATVQDPIFTDYEFTVTANGRPDIAGKTLNWKGNYPQNTPLWNVQLGGSYAYKNFSVFANAIRTGTTYSTSANTYRLHGYTDMIAGVGTKFFEKKIEFRFWANNLLDARSIGEGNVRGEQFINEKDLVAGQPMIGRVALPRSFWLSVAYNL